MNYRWRMLMQVAQSQSHISQYSIADSLGGTPYLSRQVDEVLHHQHRQWGALLEADTEELYDAWVVQST